MPYNSKKGIDYMYKDFELPNVGACSRCDNNGGTGRKTWGLDGYPLASVYGVLQGFDKLYDEKTAFGKGTIFSELDLPFMGESVYRGGCNRG